MKRTPLYSSHQSLGGKLIGFGGWEMPVHYSSITEEHLAVRSAAGIFDISHMGEVLVNGSGAQTFLNRVLTNDIRKLAVGAGQYTLMCNPQGGVVDDLYAYRTGEQEYLLIVNASRIPDDVAWLRAQLNVPNSLADVEVSDISEQMGAVAVQGPAVVKFVNHVFPGPFREGTPISKPTDLRKNQAAATSIGAAPIWVARTGYTGEDGFEIIAPAHQIALIWEQLMAAGVAYGLKPAGLGARDTLRTEMCYPLYGHELNEQTTPIEAGLGFFVALEKGDFTGRGVLQKQKQEGTSRKLAAFRMNGRCAPPRPDYPVLVPDQNAVIGTVASGTQSPSLGLGIGMAYVPTEYAQPETLLEIEVRGTRCPATVVQKPIYRKLDGSSRP